MVILLIDIILKCDRNNIEDGKTYGLILIVAEPRTFGAVPSVVMKLVKDVY